MKTLICAAIGITLIAGAGCAKKEKPALTIGSIEVTAPEFEKALASSRFIGGGKKERKEFLDTFISRKLMLKEAEQRGLDKDPSFLDDIQMFWEQSLLRKVIAYKARELSSSVNVSDGEVRAYYDTHKGEDFGGKELSLVYNEIKRILFKEKQAKALEEWAEGLRKDASITIDNKLLGIE